MGKDKKEKKEKKSKQKEEAAAAPVAAAAEPTVEKKEKKKKEKKEKKNTEAAAPAPAVAAEEDSSPPSKKQKTEFGAEPAAFVNEDERKIFIGGCPDGIDDDAVKGVFQGVESARWVTKDGQFRGFGFITFETREQAQEAANLGSVEILGRTCRVNMAGEKPQRDNNRPQGGNAGGAGAAGGRFADDSRRVFIGKCPDTIDDSAVSGLEGFESVRWVSDKVTGKFKGCGFITFADEASAQKVASQGTLDVNGQSCTVKMASDPIGGGGGFGGGGFGGGAGGRPARDDSKTVFIGSCPDDINDDDVKNVFSGVSNVRWVTDRDTKAFKGVGFIEFNSESEAQAAAQQGSVEIKGNSCRVSMAGDKPAGRGGGGGRGGGRGRGGRGGRGPKTSLEQQGQGSKMTFDD